MYVDSEPANLTLQSFQNVSFNEKIAQHFQKIHREGRSIEVDKHPQIIVNMSNNVMNF